MFFHSPLLAICGSGAGKNEITFAQVHTCPRDRRCGFDTADIGGADLASATYGYRLDTFRGGRVGADATPSTWLSFSYDHGSVKNRIGDSQLTIESVLRCYKPREIERGKYTVG